MRLPLLLASLALIPACSALDVVEIADCKDWNLEQLHTETGAHTLRAATLGDTEYFLRFGIGGLFRNSRDRVQDVSDRRQKKVPTKVLRNLEALARFSSDDPRVASLQAKWAVWLAVVDPWPLVRERAVLMIGELSDRLGLEALPGLPRPEELSSTEEIDVALAQLIRAAKGSVAEDRSPNPTEQLDLQAACVLVRELTMDVERGHRALEVIEELLRAGDVGPEFRDPVRALLADLTRDLAGQALARAVRDPEPVVRAAAVQAIVRATGTRVLGPIIEQMAREPSAVVLVRVLRILRATGLPKVPDEVEPEVAARIREVWVDVLYSFATSHPEVTVRVNAMQTLRAVVGGPASLRAEDWQHWWHQRQVERGEA